MLKIIFCTLTLIVTGCSSTPRLKDNPIVDRVFCNLPINQIKTNLLKKSFRIASENSKVLSTSPYKFNATSRLVIHIIAVGPNKSRIAHHFISDTNRRLVIPHNSEPVNLNLINSVRSIACS